MNSMTSSDNNISSLESLLNSTENESTSEWDVNTQINQSTAFLGNPNFNYSYGDQFYGSNNAPFNNNMTNSTSAASTNYYSNNQFEVNRMSTSQDYFNGGSSFFTPLPFVPQQSFNRGLPFYHAQCAQQQTNYLRPFYQYNVTTPNANCYDEINSFLNSEFYQRPLQYSYNDYESFLDRRPGLEQKSISSSSPALVAALLKKNVLTPVAPVEMQKQQRCPEINYNNYNGIKLESPETSRIVTAARYEDAAFKNYCKNAKLHIGKKVLNPQRKRLVEQKTECASAIEPNKNEDADTQRDGEVKKDGRSEIPKKKKRLSRTLFTPAQVERLKEEFSKSDFMERKRELAKEIGLTERQVQVWFQNRRVKKKKEQ